MNKKASLSLSINAIVVIVIAFVVLGLALGLTKTIFGSAESKLDPAFSLTDLEKQPTPDNPITINDKVTIGRGKTDSIQIGYYNTDANSHDDVALEITDCQASAAEAQAVISDETKPRLTSIKQDVGPSEAVGYKVILTENDLLGGHNYICTIAAVSSDGETHESKQFFLYVTA